jgi:hypothetical protein
MVYTFWEVWGSGAGSFGGSDTYALLAIAYRKVNVFIESLEIKLQVNC